MISSRSLAHPMSRREWLSTLQQRRKQWLEMLGLWPLPERTPLELESNRLLDRKDYIVERLHFQSLPEVHVPGNLYAKLGKRRMVRHIGSMRKWKPYGKQITA